MNTKNAVNTITLQLIAEAMSVKKHLIASLQPQENLNNNSSFYANFQNQTIWHLIILVVVPFFVFIKTVNFIFIDFDDVAIVVDNTHILSSIKNIGLAFKTDAFLHAHGDFYRPIQTVTFFIDALIGGENPWIYHLSNLVYHLLTTICLYYLLRSFKIGTVIALLAALLFSVHPLVSSAVSWVPARGDVLLGLWSILTLLTLNKSISSKNIVFLILHFVVFALAAFTKEAFVVLPILLAGYYWLMAGELFSLKKLFPFFVGWVAIGAFYFYMRSFVVTTAPPDFVFGLQPFINNLPTIPIVLAKFLVPASLSTMPLFQQGFTILGLALLAGLIYILVKSFKQKQALPLFGTVWFLAFLLPPLAFKLVYSHLLVEYYEHRTYAAMIGLIVIVAFFVNKQLDTGKHKWALYMLIIANIVFIPLASLHADDFKNSITFFSNAAEKNNPGALTKRGEFYYLEQDYKNAQSDFNEAVTMSNSLYPPAFFNRGLLNAEVIKDHAAAEQDYTTAISLDPKYTEAYINRANERIFLLNYQGAYQDIGIAKTLDSTDAKVYFVEGSIDINNKQFKKAVKNFSSAIQLDSFYVDAYNDRGFALYNLKDYSSALKDYSKTIELFPQHLNAYYNKGMVYYELKQPQEAITRFDSALALANNFYYALFYRGMAKKDKNDISGACNDWQESVKLGFTTAQDTIKKYCPK